VYSLQVLSKQKLSNT